MKPAVLITFIFSLCNISLPSHCRCRGLLLHLITLNNTHTHTHTATHSLGLPWTRDRPVAETKTSMSAAGFGPAIPASERPQTHVRPPVSAMLITNPTHRGRYVRCLDDVNLLSNSEIYLSSWTTLWTLAKSRDQILAERNNNNNNR
jgi:hypothetical protein